MDNNQFKCDRCDKIFNLRHHLTRHLIKKIPCKPENESKRIQVNPIESNIIEIYTSEEPGSSDEKQDQLNHECNYCKKQFSTNSNLHKHMKRSCKKKVEEENYIKLHNMFEQMKREMETLKNNPQNITINNSSTNSSVTNNVQLNNYGKETTDYLENAEFFNKIKMMPNLLGILEYANAKYGHPDHSENWNLAITNLKHDVCKVFENNRWITRTTSEILARNLLRGATELQDKLEMVALENGRKPDCNDEILDKFERQMLDNYDKATCFDVLDPFYSHKLNEAIEKHKQYMYDHTNKNIDYFNKRWGKKKRK